MALLAAQLLFYERVDERTVRLDVVVAARVECPSSPDVGAPLAFEFRLPEEAEVREPIAAAVERWCAGGTFVGMDVVTQRGRSRVRLATATAAVTLDASAPRRAPAE